MVSVVFRLVRSWLFCDSGFWLRLFIAGSWLADVGCGVRCSSTWNVLISVMLGRGDTLLPVGTLGRRQVDPSRNSDTGGRCVMHARLVFWGPAASGMGTTAVDRKSSVLGVFEMSARTCLPPLRALTVEGYDAPGSPASGGVLRSPAQGKARPGKISEVAGPGRATPCAGQLLKR